MFSMSVYFISLQVEWRGLGRISGVRAVHAEVVSGAPPFCVGDKVRVRAAVTQPRYKWGCIDHSSVGTVKGKSTLFASYMSRIQLKVLDLH